MTHLGQQHTIDDWQAKRRAWLPRQPAAGCVGSHGDRLAVPRAPPT